MVAQVLPWERVALVPLLEDLESPVKFLLHYPESVLDCQQLLVREISTVLVVLWRRSVFVSMAVHRRYDECCVL